MAAVITDLLYSMLCCFPGSSPQLRIGGKSFKILRLLGEGGFSYVYLVQDTASGSLYALKKIRCPFGQESVAQALKEVEAYALFTPHPNIIHAIDHSVVSDASHKIGPSAASSSEPGSKTVYILLPYFRRGNLQDLINANLVNHTRFPERRLMVLFLGVCRALKAMHQYRVQGGPGGADAAKKARAIRDEAARADDDAAHEAANGAPRRKMGRGNVPDHDVDDDEHEERPLMEGEVTMSQAGVPPGEVRAYAHRDIKPGNIMIADDGKTPILMDLGSLAPSPIAITSRSLALQVQDTAAEHSTMPYRAPELFDVKTGTIIDTKVDVWSLGCTLYACLVGKSPFEARSEETGGSLSLCVLGGDWRFPDEGKKDQFGKQKAAAPAPGSSAAGGAAKEDQISEPVKNVVRNCLQVEPHDRPDIDALITQVEGVVQELGGPEEGTIDDGHGAFGDEED